MLIALIFIIIGIWLFWNALKFYRNMDWNEPAEPSPDFQGMHKKEAQLLHIQEFLEEAHKEGKISSGLIQEYNQFFEKEMQATREAESAWKNRRKHPASA